jgi:hypothetical protein
MTIDQAVWTEKSGRQVHTALRNESANKFVDIQSEQYRTYVFPGGTEITITEPSYLSVNAGGHRILDSSGTSHYIPKGWQHLKWSAYPDQPHFVK